MQAIPPPSPWGSSRQKPVVLCCLRKSRPAWKALSNTGVVLWCRAAITVEVGWMWSGLLASQEQPHFSNCLLGTSVKASGHQVVKIALFTFRTRISQNKRAATLVSTVASITFRCCSLPSVNQEVWTKGPGPCEATLLTSRRIWGDSLEPLWVGPHLPYCTCTSFTGSQSGCLREGAEGLQALKENKMSPRK